MTQYRILRNTFTPGDLVAFQLWAMNNKRIHRGNATDGKYYSSYDGEREYNVWWTTQPPEEMWIPIVKRIQYNISDLMKTSAWTIHAVDCITTRPHSQKVHAHIDFPYKFAATKTMDGVLGVQIIIPLNTFTIENGATIFYPESNMLDYDDIVNNQKQYNELLLDKGTQFVSNIGDVLMYDGRTLHSTMPNNSDSFRSALLINAIRNDALDIVRENDVNTDSTTRGYYSPQVLDK